MDIFKLVIASAEPRKQPCPSRSIFTKAQIHECRQVTSFNRAEVLIGSIPGVTMAAIERD